MKYFIACLILCVTACGSAPIKEPSQFEPVGTQKLRPIGCEELRIEIKEYNKKHGTDIVADC